MVGWACPSIMDTQSLIERLIPEYRDGKVLYPPLFLAVSGVLSLFSAWRILESFKMEDLIVGIPNSSLAILAIIGFCVAFFVSRAYKLKAFADMKEDRYSKANEAIIAGTATPESIEYMLLGTNEFGFQYKLGIIASALITAGVNIVVAYVAMAVCGLDLSNAGIAFAFAFFGGFITPYVAYKAYVHPEEVRSFNEEHIIPSLEGKVTKYLDAAKAGDAPNTAMDPAAIQQFMAAFTAMANSFNTKKE